MYHSMQQRETANLPSSLQITASAPHEIDLIALTNLVANVVSILSKKESATIHLAGQMFDSCCLLQD